MAAALVRDPAESLKSGEAIAETRERNCDLTGVCLDLMVSVSRFALAKRLDSLGLRKTLIVVKKADRYAVNRINRIDHTLDLTAVGSFRADLLPNRLRRQITSLPREKIFAQVTRDDQYAVIGSYYSVFRAIMDAKRRVPLILIDDTFLSLGRPSALTTLLNQRPKNSSRTARLIRPHRKARLNAGLLNNLHATRCQSFGTLRATRSLRVYRGAH